MEIGRYYPKYAFVTLLLQVVKPSDTHEIIEAYQEKKLISGCTILDVRPSRNEDLLEYVSMTPLDARALVANVAVSWGEGQCGDAVATLMAKIATLFPRVKAEFEYLPWAEWKRVAEG